MRAVAPSLSGRKVYLSATEKRLECTVCNVDTGYCDLLVAITSMESHMQGHKRLI